MGRRRRGGPGLLAAAGRTAVIAGTATAVSGGVSRRQQQRWDSPAAPQPQPLESAPPETEPDYVAELRQLARLRDEGIVTSDEFEAKKKQLLGI